MQQNLSSPVARSIPQKVGGLCPSKSERIICLKFFFKKCGTLMLSQKNPLERSQRALRKPSGNPQESLRKLSGIPQESLWKPSGIPQKVLRNPSGSP
jgi:hypothetical protein